MSRSRTVRELAALAGASVAGSGDIEIERVSAVDDASAGSLTFAVDSRWVTKALESRASALIVPADASSIERGDKSLIIAQDVRAVLATVLKSFAPELPAGAFTHSTAVVEPSAVREPGVWIGPGVIVSEGAHIGAGAILLAGAYVGRGARIGERTLMHPRAVVLDDCIIGDECVLNAGCVIGADGFGFVRVGEEHVKIPQIGNVVVGDRVEVGACSTIDRAVTGSTVIGSGTKIDNLVQIGHNAQVGENCVLCGQVGIAGSARIGRGTTIAGQAGIAGHIEIGERSLVLAQAGVTHSIASKSRVSGFPAQPHRDFMEQQVLLRKLPKLVDQVRALMDAVAELRKRQ